MNTVNYQILFTKRGGEAILEYETITVAKTMTCSGFASWRIAQLVKNGFKQPKEWTDPLTFAVKEGDIYKLKDQYFEFLQVEYQVLSTFDRKPAEYEKDVVGFLEKISSTLETIANKPH